MENLTLEQKKEKLRREYEQDLNEALERLEKTESANNERVNVTANIEREFDKLSDAITANSQNIRSLISKFREDYYTDFFINIGDARMQTLKRQAKELKTLEKQHKQEKDIISSIYNLKFDTEPSNQVISVEERITKALAKRSQGTNGIPDYRVLIIDGKAKAIIKQDGTVMLSSINVPYSVNDGNVSVTKNAILKSVVFVKEANKDINKIPTENVIELDTLNEEQQASVKEWIEKNN
ncbi:hypothetical protein [Flavobacterium crassostreae]|uniref:Uncharacterized protein n=1 Tax=Flavobacterium crassostreae TaxID=1763534 RepID=A0A1B9DKN5_9FLAO|nr:hypothetical protein [Flavobacterium crassostreae]OCB70203.1 hypothetical protein LPBF_12215 [Flavobacterium crassostreae]